MQIKSAKDLIVYQKAYELAVEIFAISKDFPAEEKYSLTDQIRRSSRSVCANLREAWAKRKYEAHFVSKLTEPMAKTVKPKPGWISPMTANTCRRRIMPDVVTKSREVGAMLGSMINRPAPFILKPTSDL